MRWRTQAVIVADEAVTAAYAPPDVATANDASATAIEGVIRDRVKSIAELSTVSVSVSV